MCFIVFICFFLTSPSLFSIDANCPNTVFGDFFSLLVLGPTDFQPPPVLLSSRLSDDGGSIVNYFDSPSHCPNCAEFAFRFDCSILLSFPSDSISLCYWLDLQRLVIIIGQVEETQSIAPGVLMTLKASKVRGHCPAACSDSAATFAGTQSTILLPPANPLSPSILLSTPATATVCDDLAIDASGTFFRDANLTETTEDFTAFPDRRYTGSSGSGRKPWVQVQWQVDFQGKTNAELEAYLNSDCLDITRTVVIPREYLQEMIGEFAITLRLKNCFGKFSAVSKTINLMRNAVVPIVSIAGPAMLTR